MVNVNVVPVEWQGTGGGYAVSVFHAAAEVEPDGVLENFFTAIKGSFPSGVIWSIPTTGDTIDAASGELVGEWHANFGTSVSANGGATSWVRGTGAYIVWSTGVILGGRRVRGRTFLCPLIAQAFDAGTITESHRSTIDLAGQGVVAHGILGVYHRPGAKNAPVGSFHLITGVDVPDKVTSLSGRRS